MSDSDKARTNKKWTSSDKYREAHERIFKKDEKKPEPEKTTKKTTKE